MELLNKIKANEKMTGKLLWIINTSASNHMTDNLKKLQKVHDIVAYPVGLPNEAKINVVKEGKVFLEEGLKLTSVLYVPKLSCNLVPISQLLEE
ncbi:hypothetical protein Fmac_004307 [Flemingia macrophylla]|uniref:Retrovirus-related Pol polyprotein from transposon TNT 1-94-like beta-barrel domain-containing protein n=1 Tax=Flemingia macrophylla TaxID=520843 RepID=A0ABD1N5F1_9FABA